jgi:hypothetical protein
MNTICQSNRVADNLKFKGCYTKPSNTSMLQNFQYLQQDIFVIMVESQKEKVTNSKVQERFWEHNQNLGTESYLPLLCISTTILLAMYDHGLISTLFLIVNNIFL